METFSVTGMSCAACSARIEKVVGQVPGVETVAVNLLTNSMAVDYAAPADPGAICRAVEQAGYGARPNQPLPPPKRPGRSRSGSGCALGWRPASACCCPWSTSLCWRP